jgi:hypothetical protein
MPLPGFQLRSAKDKHDRKLLSDIERVGWHAIHNNQAEEEPAFTFSVGFYYTFQQPEILIMGLRKDVAHSILSIAAERMAAGKAFQPFERITEFAKGYECAFAPIEVEHYPDYLGYPIWLAGRLNDPRKYWQWGLNPK